MKRVAVLAAVALSLLWLGSAWGQFSGGQTGISGCGPEVGGSFGGTGVSDCAPGVPAPQPTPGGGTTPCTSTGILNLSNVCNDIYFIGALK